MNHSISSALYSVSENMKIFWNSYGSLFIEKEYISFTLVPLKIRGESPGGEEFKSDLLKSYQL